MEGEGKGVRSTGFLSEKFKGHKIKRKKGATKEERKVSNNRNLPPGPGGF